MEKKISVIIPVYNVEKYLQKCLESIMKQKYQNLEIILIDDGSTDQSGSICDQYQKKDARIRVMHQENAGVSAARNRGLLKCTGEYITFVDPDDWIEPDMYQQMMMTIHKEQAQMVLCNSLLELEKTKEQKVQKNDASDISEAKDAFLKIFQNADTMIWNKIYEKEILMKNGKIILFDEAFQMGEDEVWLAEIYANHKCKSVATCQENYYHWRIRENGAHYRATMGDIDAKEKVICIMQQAHAEQELIEVVATRLYQSGMALRIIAYAYQWGTPGSSQYIAKRIRPYRKIFYERSKFSTVGKFKRQLMDFAMDWHLPKVLVHALHNMTTYQQ